VNQALTAQGAGVVTFQPNTTLTPPRETLQAVADFLQGSPEEFIVVSPTMTEHAHATIMAAISTLIVTDEDYKQAGERLNRLGKIEKALGERYLSRGAAFRAVAAAFKAEADKVIVPAAIAREHLSKEMGEYRRLQEEARAAAIKKQQEEQRAEEARKAAALAEAQRAAAAAAAAAEAKQRETERLQWEAQERERLAAEGLMVGTRTAESVTEGSANLAAAAEVEAQAERARVEAEDAKRLADQAAAQLVAAEQEAAAPLAIVTEPAIIPTITKAKGTKFKKVVELLGTDKAKLSLTYLEIDEAKLKKHILDGALGDTTPNVITEALGVKYVIREVATGTGR
jgi:hypothetical protein